MHKCHVDSSAVSYSTYTLPCAKQWSSNVLNKYSLVFWRFQTIQVSALPPLCRISYNECLCAVSCSAFSSGHYLIPSTYSYPNSPRFTCAPLHCVLWSPTADYLMETIAFGPRQHQEAIASNILIHTENNSFLLIVCVLNSIGALFKRHFKKELVRTLKPNMPSKCFFFFSGCINFFKHYCLPQRSYYDLLIFYILFQPK